MACLLLLLFGAATQLRNVTDRAIHKVASTTGRMADLTRYGAQDSMP